MTITEFARSRNLKEQTVFKYLYRHNLEYDKSTGLTEELLNVLEEKYPLPRPVQIIQGLDPEEERRLRMELEATQKALNAAKDKIIELTEKSSKIELIELKNDDLTKELDRLKKRNLIQRIFNV